MKKSIYVVLLMVLALGISACDKGKEAGKTGEAAPNKEMQKAGEVQGTVDDKAAADKKAAEGAPAAPAKEEPPKDAPAGGTPAPK